MKSNTFEAIIGALVITLSIVFLYFGFSSIKLNNSDSYNILALFNRIDGLKLAQIFVCLVLK